MNNSKKQIIVIALVVLTILIGVVAVILAQIVQQNQSPNSSAASGFGNDVDPQFFEEVDAKFAKLTCDDLYNKDSIKDLGDEKVSAWLKASGLKINTEVPRDKMPKLCTYDLGLDRKIVFAIHTYDQDSTIDDSAEALYARINNLAMKSQIETLEKYSSKIFLGEDKLDPNSCTATIFHKRNDFEFASIKYIGFTACDTADMKLLNSNFTSIISKRIFEVMTGFNR